MKVHMKVSYMMMLVAPVAAFNINAFLCQLYTPPSPFALAESGLLAEPSTPAGSQREQLPRIATTEKSTRTVAHSMMMRPSLSLEGEWLAHTIMRMEEQDAPLLTPTTDLEVEWLSITVDAMDALDYE